MRCPNCGHDKFHRDHFVDLRGVSRTTPGNVVCAKCKKPVQLKTEKA